MMNTQTLPTLQMHDLYHFEVETLFIKSQCLLHNPLGDSANRYNPLLSPKDVELKKNSPVIFVLAGFTGNAPFYFNGKFNEKNAVQTIDEGCRQGQAPLATYVFVDALTTWGGSQFINSAAVGNYEDYIIRELIPALEKHLGRSIIPETTAIIGGSSGGYGALHLASKFPEIFGHCLAIAPDSFFSASLMSDLYIALPYWEKQGNAKKILEDLRSGKLTKQKNWHSLLNAFGMAACYAPTGAGVEFQYPLHPKTGSLIPEVWKHFEEHDPVFFLKDRLANLRQLKTIYLDVGNKDNFHLQYGARQIATLLTEAGIPLEYSEFDGNHFDIGDRRTQAWQYLATLWRA